jgi:hypothetical protein
MKTSFSNVSVLDEFNLLMLIDNQAYDDNSNFSIILFYLKEHLFVRLGQIFHCKTDLDKFYDHVIWMSILTLYIQIFSYLYVLFRNLIKMYHIDMNIKNRLWLLRIFHWIRKLIQTRRKRFRFNFNNFCLWF